MKPEDIEQMERDREAGTDGPWRLSGLLIEGQSGAVCLMGEPAQYAGDKSRMLDNWEVNARRIARVPTLEAEVLRLRGALEDITGVGFDAPMTWGGTDAEWERKRANIMQVTAEVALKGESP